MLLVIIDCQAVPPGLYVLISETGICFVVFPSITIKASVSARVIDDVDLAEPSNKLSSASVELTAANLVKSAYTNPETPSNKFNSAAVELTAVLPNTNCPSGTTILAAPPRIKSSSDSSHSI